MKRVFSYFLALALCSVGFEPCHAGSNPYYVTPVDDEATRMRAVDLNNVEHTLYEQSHALLIGESDYANWSGLPAVRQEVLALRNALEKHRFKVEVYFDLGAAEFPSVVDDFMRRRATVPNSRIFVYVSGHGWRRNLPRRPAGYFVPVDAPSEKSGTSTLAAATIGLPLFAAWAQSPDPRHMLFIFDACFSGSFFGRPDPDVPLESEPAANRTPAAGAQRPAASPPAPLARGLEVSDHIFQPLPRDRGRQFITAGSGNQIAPPDSIFTRLLIDILEGRRVASANFDNWTTGRSMGIWLEQNTRREYRGTSSPTTPVFGTLRDELYENGDFVFTRMDVPNVYLLPEENDPFVKLIAERKAIDADGTITAEAIEKRAAQNIAEKAADKLNEEARKASDAAEEAKKGGSPKVSQYESRAKDLSSKYEKAQVEAKKLASESQASLDLIKKAKSDEEAVKLAASIDAAAMRLASTRPPPSADIRLSVDSEKALQAVVESLSDDNTERRRQARVDLAKTLSALPPEQRKIATSRLLRDFSGKSYRYQLGVTTALAIAPNEFMVENKNLARVELERSKRNNSDKTLANATSRVLALEGLRTSTVAGEDKPL